MTSEESVLKREIRTLIEARNTLKHLDTAYGYCVQAIEMLIARKTAKLALLRQCEFSDEEITGAVD